LRTPPCHTGRWHTNGRTHDEQPSIGSSTGAYGGCDWEGAAPDFGGPIKCPDCDKEFKNRASLAAHQRHAHGRVSKAKQQRGQRATGVLCQQPKCDRMLYNEAALRTHLWHAHQVTDGYMCPAPGCDRRFALPSGVGRHLAAIYSDKREFCAICGRDFKIGGLWLHIDRAHRST